MERRDETQRYLERVFTAEADGAPRTHQPVYGVLDARFEPHQYPAFVRAYAQLRALARFGGLTLLDVGAAEGWVAWLARDGRVALNRWFT